MVVAANRRINGHLGGYSHGFTVTYASGTTGFVQGVTLVDTSNPDASVGVVAAENRDGYYVNTQDPRLDSVLDLLNELLTEQRLTNNLLRGVLQ